MDAPRQSEAPAKYTYDPKNAKISKAVMDPDPNKASFTVNLAKHAPGMLFFKSYALPADTVVSGPINVSLSFSTSAYDTDFFASMVDIDENGKALSLGTARKIRCSYLQGFDKQVALKPGRIYQAKFRLWDFAHQFKKGHRIGLIINSASFPMFARNLGTIDPIRTATRMIVQHESIYHDARHPSTVTFQVSQ
jgi:putative CocE/NonD family hydrolase